MMSDHHQSQGFLSLSAPLGSSTNSLKATRLMCVASTAVRVWVQLEYMDSGHLQEVKKNF